MKMVASKLIAGDTIGVIAPSGLIKDYEMLECAIKNIEERGYKVKLGNNIKKKKWYLAGTDEERCMDLMDCFADPEVKAIFTARGGYGCARILEYIDYELIKRNPKILLGYSDITALHSAIYKHTGLVTFHGLLTASDLGKKDLSKFTLDNMWNMFETEFEPPYLLNNSRDTACINMGKARGKLIGGNLAVICSLMGTKYSYEFEDKILFLEDVGESLYRLDRYLMQLKLAGVFKKVRGIIFGEFTDITNSDIKEVNNLMPLQLIQDILHDVKTPAIYGFSCGHSPNKSTLPIGVECELNSVNGSLKIVKHFIK